MALVNNTLEYLTIVFDVMVKNILLVLTFNMSHDLKV